MHGKGRPPIRDGEHSSSINLRLPDSDFDNLYSVAKYVGVSIPEVVRRYIPSAVNEQLYGAVDGRPPIDARHLDAILDYFNAEYLEKVEAWRHEVDAWRREQDVHQVELDFIQHKLMSTIESLLSENRTLRILLGLEDIDAMNHD